MRRLPTDSACVAQTTEAELKAGQAMYFDAVEHAGEFTGTTEARALLVELK